MLPKERIRAAFELRPTDKVPIHHIHFSSQVASQVLGREAYVGGGIQQWREARALWEGEEAHREFLERSRKDAYDLSIAMGHDLLRLEYWRMRLKPARKIDDYTFLYGDPEGNWSIYRFEPKAELFQIIDRSPGPAGEMDLESLERSVKASEKSIESYHPTPETFAETHHLIETYGKEHAVRVNHGGLGIPYENRVWLEATVLRPGLVARHLEVQAEYAVRSVEALASIGAEYIFGGGDFASNSGPFYSPRVFHELMLPPLKRISDACRRFGLRYLFASDGNLWPVADDLFGASGVDGFYEIDRRAGMDLRRLRERFPRLTLIGNISSMTLHLGTREEVIEETRSCLEEARRSGGIIVGVSNSIVAGTPMSNLEAMRETIERYR